MKDMDDSNSGQLVRCRSSRSSNRCAAAAADRLRSVCAQAREMKQWRKVHKQKGTPEAPQSV
jgi:hypothetical protein